MQFGQARVVTYEHALRRGYAEWCPFALGKQGVSGRVDLIAVRAHVGKGRLDLLLKRRVSRAC